MTTDCERVDDKVAKLEQRMAALDDRLSLLEDKCGIGLWEAVLYEGDAFHEKSTWTWSAEFRRLAGFETEAEFPNVVGSWFDRLHPDDVDATVAAFAGHLEDKTGASQYDVTYRLKVRDGSYKYFRATGGCKWAADGVTVRTCGSLIPVHDQVMLQQAAEKSHDEDEIIVNEVAQALAALADGNLTYRIGPDMPEKGMPLQQHFNNATAKVGETMSSIVAIATTMRRDSGEINGSIEQLSRRSLSQASSLEESVSALEGTTASVRNSADAAAKTAQVTNRAKEAAEDSAGVVERAVVAMDEIEKSADEISRIIRVIDEIAFQINLLALNASVEAARAGDVGRGFAVVAHEVRELAGRTATAAQDINGLIQKSSTQVKGGVKLVGETGEALKGIIEQVVSIATFVDEIAGSSREQSASLAEINTSMSSMEQITQQNANMASETSGAATDLDHRAAELAQMLGAFQLENAPGQAHPHTRAA